MKRVLRYLVVFTLCVGIFSLTGVISQASGAVKRDLMISSLETSRTVSVDQKEMYTVSIASIDPIDPKASMKAYNDAQVTVYFKNADNKLIKSVPKARKNGQYVGKVTLPDTGSWDVLVMALRKGEKEAADQSNVYTLTTQWAVHPSQNNGTVWIYGIGGAILILIALFGVRRIRRKNKKKIDKISPMPDSKMNNL